jgi:hypothetical protein
VPTAPASAGVRIALLSYGFRELTGDAVAIASITAFSVGVAAMLAAVGLAMTIGILGRELGTASPRKMVARLRERLSDAPSVRSGLESAPANHRAGVLAAPPESPSLACAAEATGQRTA